jgi:PST family polysaccharide transporter
MDRMPKERKTRATMMIAFGAASAVVLPFVRNIALAHMIAPEQFGLAVALALAAGVCEIVTDFGIGNSAMRLDHDSHGRSALPTLHVILLFRACVAGLILAISGFPLAYLFGVPEAAASFSALGLAAVIRGLSHLGPQQQLRNFVYTPSTVSTVGEHVVWTAVTVGTAFVVNDYRCMLFGIIAGAIANMILTHIYSREPWRLGWSRETAREALAYGGPLVPNGIALALYNMGDRFLIGSFLGLAQLAYYSVSSTAAFMPRSVVLRVLGAVNMPLFLRHGREGVVSSRIVDYWGLILSAIGAAYSIVFLCFGSLAIRLVFGAQYAPDQALITCIALSVYLKYMMTLPHPLALVFGQTKLILASTIISSLALACGGLAMLIDARLWIFVLGLAIGELVTVIWTVAISIRTYGFMPRLIWSVTLFPILVLGAAHALCAIVPFDAVTVRIEILLSALFLLLAGYLGAWKIAKLPWIPEVMHSLRASGNASSVQV